jgi:hypothetical protein
MFSKNNNINTRSPYKKFLNMKKIPTVGDEW